MTSTRAALKPTRASPSVSADAGAAISGSTASGNAITVQRSTRISVLDRRSAVRRLMRRFRGGLDSGSTASGNAITVQRSTRISVLDRRSAVRRLMRRFRGGLDSGGAKPIFARARSLRRNGIPEMDKRIGLYAFGNQALGRE